MRELQSHGFEPLRDAGLAGMNLLPSADEAYHDGPGFVPVEIGDEEPGSDR